MFAEELPYILNPNELPVCPPDASGWKARVYLVTNFLSTAIFMSMDVKHSCEPMPQFFILICDFIQSNSLLKAGFITVQRYSIEH